MSLARTAALYSPAKMIKDAGILILLYVFVDVLWNPEVDWFQSLLFPHSMTRGSLKEHRARHSRKHARSYLRL